MKKKKEIYAQVSELMNFFSIFNKFRFKFKIEELVRELGGISTFPISALGFKGQIPKCLEEKMRVDKSSKNFNESLLKKKRDT